MIARLSAAAVHLLTASGAVLALLALRAVHQGDWQMMFVWLGAALIVDAVDGPLARTLEVKTVLPRFSGERLDLIVDYLTYVVVPAYALTEAPLLPDHARLPAAAAILLSSLFHVADMESKTEEGYFVGFPAIWNIVLLYLFALGLPPMSRSPSWRRSSSPPSCRCWRCIRFASCGCGRSPASSPCYGLEPPAPLSPIPFHRRSGCKSCSSRRRFISRASASTARLPEPPHPLLTRQPDYQLNSAFNTAPRPSPAT